MNAIPTQTKFVVAIMTLFTLAACTGGNTPPPPTTPTDGGGNTPPPPATYTIGGTVFGLISGQRLVLQNNGAGNLTVNASGDFTFASSVAADSSYGVTIYAQPSGQQCSVQNSSGVANGNVTDVEVLCTMSLDATPWLNSVKLSWGDVGATSYDIYYSTDALCDVAAIVNCNGGSMVSGVTSPHTVTGLTNGQHYSFWLKANYGSGRAIFSSDGARPDKLSIGGGSVMAIATGDDGTVYVGGLFRQVGARSGGGVPLRMDSDGTHPFPLVDGSVNAVASDGAGGWYIGGSFTQVGGVARNNLAHILADGSVAPWNPNVSGNKYDTSIHALAVSDSVIYVGGRFTTIDGQTRNNIAALDASSGAVLNWDPNANDDVNALMVSGGVVYAGGDFIVINGQWRDCIAALDANTGAALAWNPDVTSPPIRSVFALAMKGSTIYVGGYFDNIGGKSRKNIAAVDASTGNVMDWDPSAGYEVHALAISGNTVYAGGGFNSIGGQRRDNIAALDADTGVVSAWNPALSGQVYALAVIGNTVYAGGYISTVDRHTRNGIAALDATTAAVTTWDPNVGGRVNALAVSGTTVYAGGEFSIIGGEVRNRLAAFDAGGNLKAWNPNVNGWVYSLAVSGTTVYVGGNLYNIGNKVRHGIAAVDAGTGDATDWDPNAAGGSFGTVNALAVNGGTVYAGGDFTQIGGAPRNYIAALDATTGLATAWNPNADNGVNALVISNNIVYAGGDFQNIGGTPRNYIAALDAATGLATDWDPSANADVATLVVGNNAVYAGGGFTQIGGQPRNYIAALDASTGLATAWDPNANGGFLYYVRALAASASTIYAAGRFTGIGGERRNYIAALDAGTGLATAWNPNQGDKVNAIAVSGGTVYVGGDYSFVAVPQ